MEQVVAREVAEAEFERFVDAMDLDVDESRMDVDDRKAYGDLKDKLLRAMEQGNLSVDDKGQLVYMPRAGKLEPITFREPTGASFMAMDTKKKDQNIAKMYALMADITGLDAKVFAQMPRRDLRICQAIVTLFLG
jgi:hypothetical protein